MITKVKRVNGVGYLPSYSYPGDAGMDLAVVGHHILNPGESRDLPTGIAVEMPAGHWGRITGRSSTLRKHGLFVNEGVIDAGYRGELLVYVTNRQSTPVVVNAGSRLAQLIVQPVIQAPAEWADELSPSDRGTNGFGSTGAGQGTRVSIDDATPDEWDRASATAIKMPEFLKPKKRQGQPVYLGGAVDLVDDAHGRDDWRHSRMWGEAGVWTYCPKCECRGIGDPELIVAQNMQALERAPMAVFDLSKQSIGTPIEAWYRIEELSKPAIIIFGTGYADSPRSVFVEYMARHSFVHVATGFSGIAEWVAGLIGIEGSPTT